MVTEFELVKKIRELKAIRPNQNWVSSTKTQILGQESVVQPEGLNIFNFLYFKPAYAGLVFVFVLIGIFGISQNSLPGDPLYLIKKITEKSQAVFISEEGKSAFQLKLTSERLDDLTKVVEANQVGKLSPALKEFTAAKAEAQKELAKTIQGKSETEAIKLAKKVAPELRVMNEKEGQVLSSLGLEPEQTEVSAEKTVVELLIKDLETASLTEEQANLFSQAKADYENGEYWQALEKILLLSSQ